MRYKLGDDKEIEITRYKPIISKGALVASFSFILYPIGICINECLLFKKDKEIWFNFPQKEVKYEDGRKTQYFPMVLIKNQEFNDRLSKIILLALNKTGKVDETPISASEGKADSLPPEPPFNWDHVNI